MSRTRALAFHLSQPPRLGLQLSELALYEHTLAFAQHKYPRMTFVLRHRYKKLSITAWFGVLANWREVVDSPL